MSSNMICRTKCLCSHCTHHKCKSKKTCMVTCISKGVFVPVLECDDFENFRVVKRFYIDKSLRARLLRPVYYNFTTPEGYLIEHITLDQVRHYLNYYKHGKVSLYVFDDM